MRDNTTSEEILNYIRQHPDTDKLQIIFDLKIFPDVVSHMVELLVGSGQLREKFKCYRLNGK